MSESLNMVTIYCTSRRKQAKTGNGSIQTNFYRRDYKDDQELVDAIVKHKLSVHADNELFKQELALMEDHEKPWLYQIRSAVNETIKKIHNGIDDIMAPATISVKDKPKVVEQKMEKLEDKVEELVNDIVEEQKPEEGSFSEISLGYNVLQDLDINFDDPAQSSIVVYGSSKRGKSTLLKYVYNKYYYKRGYISTVFTTNNHLKYYDKFDMVCNTFNERASNFLEMEHNINRKTKNHYKFFNAFDDIIHAKYSKMIANLVCTYRNTNMSTIILVQYDKIISPQNRTNLNHIILFGFNQEEAISKVVNSICKSYFKRLGITDPIDMINFYKEVTDDHGFIYIDPINDNISFHKLKIKEKSRNKK